MKKLIILLLAIALIAAPAFGVKQEDLDKLKATKTCERCFLNDADLREANLSEVILNDANLSESSLIGVDLSKSSLTGADLRDAILMRANLEGARFCNTTMPDGSVNNADC
jgi:uncharacterized protein YjbI with pentapeptide repeats